jgi:glycerate-2-kinase
MWCYNLFMDKDSLHIIKNFDELATTPARTSLLTIAEAGYKAIETGKVIRNALSFMGTEMMVEGEVYDLKEFQNVYVLGIGKCSYDSAVEIESLLKDHITDGVVLDIQGGEDLEIIKSRVGTHPYPSEENTAYTTELLDMAQRATEHDLVIIVVSGGGSTLLCQPESHDDTDEKNLVEYLFKEGATIHELNVIRKHLSKARGGHLAVAANPAKTLALIFSDVPGDDIRTISSGPTVYDESTLEDALEVFEKYNAGHCGFSKDHLFETPKDKVLFEKVHNALILKNTTALEAMKQSAESLGYQAVIRETKLQGEARIVGPEIVRDIRGEKPRTVYLYGGETTVTITGPGKGGRNQELSLSALTEIEDDELVVSLASDGSDCTEFAGGIADKYTRGKAQDEKLKPEDFLYTNDSFSFFSSLQQGIQTGYTGANVADLIIAIKHER